MGTLQENTVSLLAKVNILSVLSRCLFYPSVDSYPFIAEALTRVDLNGRRSSSRAAGCKKKENILARPVEHTYSTENGGVINPVLIRYSQYCEICRWCYRISKQMR